MCFSKIERHSSLRQGVFMRAVKSILSPGDTHTGQWGGLEGKADPPPTPQDSGSSSRSCRRGSEGASQDCGLNSLHTVASVHRLPRACAWSGFPSKARPYFEQPPCSHVTPVVEEDARN